MFQWNYGDILDGISSVIPPDAPAYIHGAKVIRWGDATRRSNNLARAILAKGAAYGDKVAFYMHNRPEYCELLAACFKARLVHVNVNYRYQSEELAYLYRAMDLAAVISGAAAEPAVRGALGGLSRPLLRIVVSPPTAAPQPVPSPPASSGSGKRPASTRHGGVWR